MLMVHESATWEADIGRKVWPQQKKDVCGRTLQSLRLGKMTFCACGDIDIIMMYFVGLCKPFIIGHHDGIKRLHLCLVSLPQLIGRFFCLKRLFQWVVYLHKRRDFLQYSIVSTVTYSFLLQRLYLSTQLFYYHIEYNAQS